MNEAWIYKRKDIDAIYQSMLMKYIAKGYKLITTHAKGCQSEYMKIHFTDGKNIYVLWYYPHITSYKSEILTYHEHFDTITLSFKKYITDGVYNDNSNTLWYDDGEIIEEKNFYNFNEYTKGWRTNESEKRYVTDIETTCKLYKKSLNRHVSDEVTHKIHLTNDDKKRIIEMIKSHNSGYSTLKIKHIACIERVYDTHFVNGKNQYRVLFTPDWYMDNKNHYCNAFLKNLVAKSGENYLTK